MGRLTLIGGGARSGKSAFGLRLARSTGARRLFVATAQARDTEMAARIDRHRRDRGADFLTVEAPIELARAVAAATDVDVVVIDCLTLWLSNLLALDLAEAEILARIDGLVAAASGRSFTTIVVSNEVGMGIVPPTPLGRVFRDLTGLAHQRLAAAADEIYCAMLGTIVRLRPSALEVTGSTR